ncbi:MAG: alpha/beta hydrolase [Acidobacteriota bacterium]|nr:alpha/beta hydrolase [Acidobacteriota bacterium]MDQ5835707.1 alpha/beta hydrolase [Acidobacteriota bacterium]
MSEALTNLDSSVRHGFAQVGDVRLHYAEAGEGERLVVLLHGFPECWYSWRHQLKALSGRFRVVAPDMRGYNLSDKPGRVEDYRVGRLVDDVTGLIRHLGAREAAVVGHDWGAVIAWAAARHYPDYVSKLAALQVPPAAVWQKNLSWRQLLRSWYMLFFQLPALPEWWIRRRDFAGIEEMFRKTARPGTFSDEDLRVLKSALKEPGALNAAVNYYRANLGSFLRRRPRAEGFTRQERVRVPTLFIFGERDFAIIPETVEGVADYVNAPYTEVRLAKSNHWVQQEYPAEVNAALLSFLEE